MTIYISHATSFDFKNNLYEVIRSSRLWEEHTFILPHEEDDVPFPTKEIFESEECDLVVAEVSHPSTGQGIELGWASMLHIPIICLYNNKAKISQSLYVVTNKFVEYMNEEDMVEKMERSIKHLPLELV